MGDTLEDGVSLGDVTSQLSKIGVQVLDGDGKMRGVGDIMEDLMGVWQSIDSTQKAAVAQTLAGKYQLSRFEALMNSPDMYNDYLEHSKEQSQSSSTYGTMDVMNEKYLDSMQGKMNQLQATIEGIISDLVDSDVFYPWLDAANNILNAFQNISQVLGGVQNVALLVGNTLLKITKNNIANALGPELQKGWEAMKEIPTHIRNSWNGVDTTKSQENWKDTLGSITGDKDFTRYYGADKSQTVNMAKYITENANHMTNDQKKNYSNLLDAMADAESRQAQDIEKLIGRGNESKLNGRSSEEIAQLVKDARQQGNDEAKEELANIIDTSNGTNTGSIKRASDSADRAAKAVQQAKESETIATSAQERLDSLNDTLKNQIEKRDTLKDETPIVQQVSKVNDAVDNLVSDRIDKSIKTLQTAQENETEISPSRQNMMSVNSDKFKSNIEAITGSGILSEDEIKSVDDAYSKLQEDMKEGITSENIATVTQDFKDLKSVLTEVQQKAKELFDSLESTPQDTALDSISDEAQNIQTQLENAEVTAQATQVEANAARNEADRSSKKAKEDSEAAGAAVKKAQEDLDTLNNQLGDLDKQNRSKSIVGDKFSGEKESDVMKRRVRGVLEFASALQDAQMAFSGAQELGKIVSDKDISGLEKFVSLLGSAGITFTGVVQGGSEFATTIRAVGAELSNADGLLGKFGDSLSHVGSLGISMFMGVLSAIMAVSSGLEKVREDTLSSSLSDYTDKQSKATADTSTFDKAYEEYRQTGKASDELRQSSLQLADALDISGGKALANAGDFDALASSIDSAKKSAQDAATSQAANSLANIENTMKDHYFGQNDIGAQLWHNSDLREASGLEVNPVFENVTSDIDMVQVLGNLSNASKQAEQNVSDLRAQLSGLKEGTAEYDNVNDQLTTAEQKLKDIQAFSGNQQFTNAKEIISDQAQMIANSAEFQKSLKQAGTDVQSITDAFNNNKAISDYFTAMGYGADNLEGQYERLGYMANAITDEQQQQAILAEQAIVKTQQYAQQQGLNPDLIKQSLDNSGLTDEQIIEFVGTLDENTTYANFDTLLRQYEQSPSGMLTLDAEIDTSSLKGVNDDVDSYQSLWDSYNKTENGFTTSEVSSMAEDHPEYLRFLTQVGDTWKMNEQAVQAYNQALTEQSNELDTVIGKTRDMSDANAFINTERQNSEEYGLNDKDYESGLDKLSSLNNQMSQGDLSGTQFLSGVNDEVDAFTDKIEKATQSSENFADVFGGMGAGAKNFAGILSGELLEGLDNLNDQYNSGQINLADYAKAMNKTQKNTRNMVKQTYNLSDAQEEVVDTYGDADKAISVLSRHGDKLTDVQKDGIKVLADYNDNLGNTQKEADAVQEFTSDMADQYENLTTVFQDNGEVMDSVMTAQGGIQEQYRQTISNLADSVVTYAQSSDEAMNQISSAIADTGVMTQQSAQQMLQSTDATENAMMNSASVASAVMTSSAASAQSAVAQMASGITGMISSMVASIGSVNGEIDSDVEVGAPSIQKINVNSPFATDDSGGTISIPTFTVGIHGNASGGDNVAATGAGYMATYTKGLTPTHNYSKGNTNAAGSEWYNPSGVWQEYKTKTGNSVWRAASDPLAAVYNNVEKFGNAGISIGKMFGAGGGGSGGTPKTVNPTGTGGKKGNGGGSGGGGRSPKKGSGGGGGGGSPKSGGSGGGGGGGGSSYTPKTEELEKSDLDRYEKVNTILDSIDETIDSIERDQDRLVGHDYLENLQSEIPILQRQIKLHQEKLSIQQEEAAELADQLSSEYGIQFDDEGFISNYKDRYNAMLDDINKLINQYNSATTEDAQDKLSDEIDKAKDKLDDFNDTYKRYDELWGKDLLETKNKIEEIRDAIQDLQEDAFNKAVDALDDLKDIQETFREFQYNMKRGIDDDPFEKMAYDAGKLDDYWKGNTKTINTYYDNLTKKYKNALKDATTAEEKAAAQTQIDLIAQSRDTAINDGAGGYFNEAMARGSRIISEIRDHIEKNGSSDYANSELGVRNEEAMYEVAKDVYEQMTQMIDDYRDDIDDLHDDIMDGIDKMSDEIDKRIDQFTDVTDQLEHIKNLTEYIYGDEAYDQQNKILSAQYDNYTHQISEMNQQIQVWKDLQDSLAAQGRQNSEEWDDITDKIRDATSDVNDLIEDAMENLQQQYTNTVNKITKAWIPAAVGENGTGIDADWLQTEWELINRNADYYLDDVNKSYNIQKLQGKYLDLLDDAQGNGLGIQQKITDQMNQQLGYLRDKTKLSEYDVQYANAQLEILQKQIALEEAQRNKDQMKLRRDTQGNYRYVYTENQDDVRNAESDLLDAQNNAYNLSKEQMKQVQDDSLSALVDAQQTVNDIWTNANLTLEEKKKRTQEIIDSLREYLEGTSEQLSTSEKNIINDFLGMCEILTDDNKDNLQDVYDQIIAGNKDAFDQIDTRWATSLTNWLQNLDDFNDRTDEMFDQLIDNSEDYEDKTTELAEVAGQNFMDISDSIQECIDKTNELAQSTGTFISQLSSSSGTIQNYEHSLSEMNSRLADSNNQMKAYASYISDLETQLSEKAYAEGGGPAPVYDENTTYIFTKKDKNGNGSVILGGYDEAAMRTSNDPVEGGSVLLSTTHYNDKNVVWLYRVIDPLADNENRDPYKDTIVNNGQIHFYTTNKERAEQKAVAIKSELDSKAKEDDGFYHEGSDHHIMTYGNRGQPFTSDVILEGPIPTSQSGYDTLVRDKAVFKSGGYTGSWDDKTGEQDNGKLAILHSKELVLNASDTSNILQAVDMVREIASAIKNGVIRSAMDSIRGMVSGMTSNASVSSDVQQEVHITAEFPNANSAEEIENAFMTLNDRALQYAFKTR